MVIEQLYRLEAKDIIRLMLFMPPRHGKSELVSRLFSGWHLRRHADQFVALSSYGADLAYMLSRNARDFYELSGGALDTSASAIKQWDTGYGGGFWACGVGGPATGKGFSLGIVDDPIKNWKDAYSQTLRESIWNWWTSTWTTRMNEEDSGLIVMNTRWHEDELAGRLLDKEKEEPEGWTVINMEAIKPKTMITFPASCTVIDDQRQVGEALCPQRFSAQALQKKKKAVGEKVWSSLYQQNPSPIEGAMWKTEWFDDDHLFDSVPPGLMFVANDWDLAYTEKETNSACAFLKAGILRNGDIYVLDFGFRWLEMPELLKWMRRISGAHYIEAKASGKSAKQMLSREGFDAIEVKIEGGEDKIARTSLVTATAESGHLYVRRSIVQMLLHDDKQGIVRFPDGANNDVNDTLVQAINRLKRKLKYLIDNEDDDMQSVTSPG